MGYSCAHAFRHLVIPLSVNDFDQHWWLLQPVPIHNEAGTMSIGIEITLKTITDEYADTSNHRKHVLVDYILAVPEKFAIVCKFACVVGHRT